MKPKVNLQICPPMMPTTSEEWQLAVDAAEALLHLDSARQYGLVAGGPTVNVERCDEILSLGQARGITPRPDSVERFIGGWNSREDHKE